MKKEPTDKELIELIERGARFGLVAAAAEKAGYQQNLVTANSENVSILYLTNIQTWLREAQGIHVWIEVGEGDFIRYFAVVTMYRPAETAGYHTFSDHSQEGFLNYSEALCDGIERALKMLEPDKNMEEK
jgi:hypothetical protein